MTLPLDQTCDCKDRALALPATYGHPNFRIDYRVELTAKKHGRFSIGGPEKLEIPFQVSSPFVEAPDLVVPGTRGTDGAWSTMTLVQTNTMDNTSAKIVASEVRIASLHFQSS